MTVFRRILFCNIKSALAFRCNRKYSKWQIFVKIQTRGVFNENANPSRYGHHISLSTVVRRSFRRMNFYLQRKYLSTLPTGLFDPF